jgi:hypothetical protein
MSLTKHALDIRQRIHDYQHRDELSPAQKALLTAGGASAAYAVPKSMKELFYDELERRVPPMSMEEAMGKVRPGDVVMSRVPKDLSSTMTLADFIPRLKEHSLGKREIPLKMNELIQLILGTPYTHASMKMQHGNDILNIMMGAEGAKMENMAEALKNQEFKIYRPYGNTPEQHQAAMEGIGSRLGKEYRSTKDTIISGLRHILDPIGTKTNLSNLCEGQTCYSAIGNAYPHIFPTEETVADTIRSSPRMEFVGRYNPGGILPTKYEMFANRVASPLLKSLKYSLPVGAAAYAYHKLKE